MANDGDKVAAAVLATGFANRYENDNCGSAIYVRAYWEVLAQIEKGPPAKTKKPSALAEPVGRDLAEVGRVVPGEPPKKAKRAGRKAVGSNYMR